MDVVSSWAAQQHDTPCMHQPREKTFARFPNILKISPLPEISAGFRVLLCANSSGPPLPRQGPGEQTPGNSLEVLDPIPCLGQPVLREELQQLPGGRLQSGF